MSAGIVAAWIAVAYQFHDAVGVKDSLTLGIAASALTLTLVTTFRAELFAFDPLVAGGDIYWVKGNVQGPGVHIALPLHFINKGYGEGVLDWVALTVRGPGWVKPHPYEAVVSVDPVQLVRAKGEVTADNQRGPFTRLPLFGKTVQSYALLFTPSHVKDRPDPMLEVGRHEFVLMIKRADRDHPEVALAFEYTFTQANFVADAAGIAQFFPNTGYRSDMTVKGAVPAG